MAAIVAGDVTYSFDLKDAQWDGRLGKKLRGTITFGDGVDTYPAGGIPLTKANMGCPNVVRSLKILESNASGYMFEYDVSAEKIRVMYIPDLDGNAADAQAQDELATDETPAAITLEVEVLGY